MSENNPNTAVSNATAEAVENPVQNQK